MFLRIAGARSVEQFDIIDIIEVKIPFDLNIIIYRSCDVRDDTLRLRYFYDGWVKYVIIWKNDFQACVSMYW